MKGNNQGLIGLKREVEKKLGRVVWWMVWREFRNILQDARYNHKKIYGLINYLDLTYIPSFKVEEFIVKHINKLLDELEEFGTKWRAKTIFASIEGQEKEFLVEYSELWLDIKHWLNLLKLRIEAIENLTEKWKPTMLVKEYEKE